MSLERFNDPVIRPFSANITNLPGAKLWFYAPNTTTPKVVYQDKFGLIPHTNPVVADSIGAFAPIFLSGLYRVSLTDANDIVQDGWPVDNVGNDSDNAVFGPWSETYNYAINDIAYGSNAKWYRSITADNLGNDPTYSPEEWSEIAFLGYWNPNETYSDGVIVIHDSGFWASTEDDNTGNEPGPESDSWDDLSVVSSLGESTSIGAGDAGDAPPGTLRYFAGTHADAVTQGFPDLGADGGDLVNWEIFTHGTDTRTVQEATQTLEVDGATGQQYINIREGETWQGWQASGSGGSVPAVSVSASRSLALTDANSELQCSSGSTIELTLALDSTTEFNDDDKISFVRLGAGLVAIQAVSGVTINGVDGGRVELDEQYATSIITKTGANTWVAPLPGGENTFRTKPVQVFTSADEVSNNISVELDASEFNAWQLDFNGSPLPGTSGNYNITLINLPDAPDQLQIYQVRVWRAGRKTVVLAAENESAATVTISTVDTLTYGSASGNWDVLTFVRWPATPTVIQVSLSDGRR